MADRIKILEESIEKWEKIVAGTGADEGTKNCALCREFFDAGDDNEAICVGCPVQQFTGIGGCENTPYITWMYHHAEHPVKTPAFAKTEKEISLAQDELNFLKEVLEAECKS